MKKILFMESLSELGASLLPSLYMPMKIFMPSGLPKTMRTAISTKKVKA